MSTRSKANKEYLATIAGADLFTAGIFMVISAHGRGKETDTKSYKKNLILAIIGCKHCF